MNELLFWLLFWLLMPYVLTFCFIVGFMAYHVPAPVVAERRYPNLNEVMG